MLGKDLYERYVEAMADQRIGVDTWGELADRDREQAAWDAVAAGVAPIDEGDM